MLVVSWLLLIILSFGSTLITGQSPHDAMRLNISSTVCGDRQDISVAWHYPLRVNPNDEEHCACSTVTSAGLWCKFSIEYMHGFRVELGAKGCDAHNHIIIYLNSTFGPDAVNPNTGIDVQPPTAANLTDLASGISPIAALWNCARGYIFSAGKYLNTSLPVPADCIDAHTGVQGFANHVVIGAGYSGYMTDEEIQQLPAPESRTLVEAAMNSLVFNNNMFTALTNAYTDAQLLVSDMKNDLVPSYNIPTINTNLGDILTIIGLALPVMAAGPLAPLAPVMVGVGSALVITGTLMNEKGDDPENIFDIVSDSRLQHMKDTTQENMINIMNNTFFTNQNYTGLNPYSNGIPEDLFQMQAPIKQHIVTWAANQFFNYFGLKVCTNPDDIGGGCGCDARDMMTKCNDKIQNLDCRFAGGFWNGAGGYYYSISDGNPTGNILKFKNYLVNGSYEDVCNGVNGWNVRRDLCHPSNSDDYITYYDYDECDGSPPPPYCC